MKKFQFFLFVLFITSGAAIFSIAYGEQPVFVKEFIGQMDYVQGKILQLEDAMPQDKFSWRPEEGVRSVGEVNLHMAFSNYLFIKTPGGTPPPDINMDFNKWDYQTNDKKEIAAIIKRSFDDAKKYASGLTENDLNKEVDFFGNKMTVRNFMVTMLNHLHEHLGQSIAYARMNNITPPWSKKGE